jgi:hypothetical protein
MMNRNQLIKLGFDVQGIGGKAACAAAKQNGTFAVGTIQFGF